VLIDRNASSNRIFIMIRKVIAIKNKIKLMDIENIYFDD
jgi:hypothetical protein